MYSLSLWYTGSKNSKSLGLFTGFISLQPFIICSLGLQNCVLVLVSESWIGSCFQSTNLRLSPGSSLRLLRQTVSWFYVVSDSQTVSWFRSPTLRLCPGSKQSPTLGLCPCSSLLLLDCVLVLVSDSWARTFGRLAVRCCLIRPERKHL